MDVDRDSSSVISYGERPVFLNYNLNRFKVTGEVLVYRIINYFLEKMV